MNRLFKILDGINSASEFADCTLQSIKEITRYADACGEFITDAEAERIQRVGQKWRDEQINGGGEWGRMRGEAMEALDDRPMAPTPTSAERLKALIERHGLTQRELAKLLQTVPATISRVLITSPKLHPGPRARLEKAEAMSDAEVLEAIGPRSKRVLKTADPEKGLAVSVHFSKVELDLVNQAAEQSGITRSDLIRDASVAHSIRILAGRHK